MQTGKNLFQTLTETLLQHKKYVAEDGQLLKAEVDKDIHMMNPELLQLLLGNSEIKKTFFVQVDGILVFDKQKFAWTINAKEFLPDSYTAYTNKIGLTSNGEFLSTKSDVVLSFPYKDCFLEGGQTKEEQKQDEIMYNEILSKSEIRNMLSPKVFTSAKKIGGGG